MNGTARLLGKSAEFLWEHPVVWLPVLVTRAVDFLIGFLLALAKVPAMMAVAPRSVLGGVVPRMNGPVVAVGLLFTWLPLLIEVVLFLYAMVVCCRWTQNIRKNGSVVEKKWSVAAAPIARTAALSFAVIGVTIYVGLYFSLRGGVPVQWTPMIVACFFLMSSWFVLPAWLRLIAREQGSRERETSRGPAFLAFALGMLGLAAVGTLANLVRRPIALHPRPYGAGLIFSIDLLVACLSSLPLAFSFVALSRHVADRPGWQDWSSGE